MSDATGSGAIGNTIEDINFQVAAGGAMRLLGRRHAKVEQIQLWDIGAATTTKDLISLGAGAASSSYMCELAHMYRSSAVLGSGLNDIKIESAGAAYSTHIHDCGAGAGGSPAFRTETNGAPGTLVENCPGATVVTYANLVTAQAAAGTGATAALNTTSTPWMVS